MEITCKPEHQVSPGFTDLGGHIHLLGETRDGYEPGYYFTDETGDLHGPVGTYEEARADLKTYAENM